MAAAAGGKAAIEPGKASPPPASSTTPAPFQVHTAMVSSPREFLSAPIVLITCSLYTDLADVRFQCALLTCQNCAEHLLPLICVDDSGPALRDEVKRKLEEAGKGWVRVVPLKGKGKKGASIRQALGRATAWRSGYSSFSFSSPAASVKTTSVTSRWAVVYLEIEKEDFVRHVRATVEPILTNQADIVSPERDPVLFKETYAVEQYHSESFAAAYLNVHWRRDEGGTCDLDWLFGPMAWEGNLVSPFYLESDEESYDAQMNPSIRAFREVGARWIGLRVPYRHHPLQRDQEEGTIEYCEKRMSQLKYVTTRILQAFASAGRFPLVIVAGAAGNIGQKVIRRLLTTDACSYIGVPLSSRSPSPDMHVTSTVFASADGRSESGAFVDPHNNNNNNIPPVVAAVLPKKMRLLLLDAKPCPADLARMLKQHENSGHQVEYAVCDLSTYSADWVKRFSGAYCAFLLAAKNPFPEADSLDSYTSMLINSNVLEACAQGFVERVVFASSNHVVGRQLFDPGQDPIAPNAAPAFGTRYSIPGASMDSTLYAAAKVAAEAQITTMVAAGRLNRAIILRIGWCQPGDNLVSTISVTGTPTIDEREEGHKRARKSNGHDSQNTVSEENRREFVLKWFRAMHLRNDDLDRLVDACLSPTLDSRAPPRLIYVNAVSDNPGSRWVVHGNHLDWKPVSQSASSSSSLSS